MRATGSTFVAVTADTVKGILLPIPPLSEQKKIVDAILKLNLELDNISSKLIKCCIKNIVYCFYCFDNPDLFIVWWQRD